MKIEKKRSENLIGMRDEAQNVFKPRIHIRNSNIDEPHFGHVGGNGTKDIKDTFLPGSHIIRDMKF